MLLLRSPVAANHSILFCLHIYIALLHNIITLLQTNDYVVVISMDLSKAFDSVCHSSLTGVCCGPYLLCCNHI